MAESSAAVSAAVVGPVSAHNGEGKMLSRQPAEPAPSEAEAVPALLGCKQSRPAPECRGELASIQPELTSNT